MLEYNINQQMHFIAGIIICFSVSITWKNFDGFYKSRIASGLVFKMESMSRVQIPVETNCIHFPLMALAKVWKHLSTPMYGEVVG